jgi:hypothetical protein
VKTASIILAVCGCLSAAGAQGWKPMSILPDDRPATSGVQTAAGQPAPCKPLRLTVGTVDTIGGTTHDWFTSGPIFRMMADSRRSGFHAVWMYSAETTGMSFTDRRMRYNFYDSRSGGWNWHDADYMQSGVSAFSIRTGYGSVDSDTDGAAVVSAHYGGSYIKPILALDSGTGIGAFDFSDTAQAEVCQWPAMAAGPDGTIHVLAMTSSFLMEYGRYAGGAWSDWRSDFPTPSFPTQSIAASKASNRVCATWTELQLSGQDPGYVRESPDGGGTWYDPELLDYPPAFSSDTQPSFFYSSLFPFYDADDRLNIVADVHPVVRDTIRVVPAEIWHYCPDNTPQWHRIQRAGCDLQNLQGSVGYNAMYACRPSIGEDDYGNLFVAWEQFDSSNVEPTTNRLRADVWASGSDDGGLTWSAATKLTTPGTASCRYPSIADRLWPGESLAVHYEVDLCAGFFTLGEGAATKNPVVVQKVARNSVLPCDDYLTRLETPNGGEFLAPGDTVAVKWAVEPRTFDHGALLLSTDGGNTFVTTIKDSIPPNDSLVRWGPVPQLSCSLCRIKFEVKDSLGATLVSDASYRNFTIDSVLTSVAENRPEPGTEARPEPTVVRGVLVLPVSPRPRVSESPCLLDACGRKVLELRPGANDIRMLAPGVYFVREAQAQAQPVRKVVVVTR